MKTKNFISALFFILVSMECYSQKKESSAPVSRASPSGIGIVFPPLSFAAKLNPSLMNRSEISTHYGTGGGTQLGGGLIFGTQAFTLGAHFSNWDNQKFETVGLTVPFSLLKLGISYYEFLDGRWNSDVSTSLDLKNARISVIGRRLRDQIERLDVGIGFNSEVYFGEIALKKIAPITTSPNLIEVSAGYKLSKFSLAAGYYLGTEIDSESNGILAKINVDLATGFQFSTFYKAFKQHFQGSDIIFLLNYTF